MEALAHRRPTDIPCPHATQVGLPPGMPCPWPRCARGTSSGTLRWYNGEESYGGRAVPVYRRWVRTLNPIGAWTWDTLDETGTPEAPIL